MLRLLFFSLFVVLFCSCRTSKQTKSQPDVTITASYADSYLSSLPQIHDSIIPAIDRTLAAHKNDTATLRFLARYLYDKYLISEMQGAENITVHLADNYYLNNRIVENAKFRKEVADFAKKFRNTLIGKQAQNLKMESINGTHEALYDIDSPYTLVYFFDPTCSHCKKETPKIYKIFRKYSNRGLAGFCVYSQSDREEWIDYVAKNNLTDWMNVWDPTNENNFRIAYSIYSVPQTYLLDKDKKIVGRRLNDETLENLLKNLLN
ncbi:MAG: TlpA family protein disulfide reductase [Prevotellaceae bacterium]|jgi:thiol-disulfide isomerase/thioredoxin|nr:TlpA family protein disulfide reductase [Prevotellaceae bacterium]